MFKQPTGLLVLAAFLSLSATRRAALDGAM